MRTSLIEIEQIEKFLLHQDNTSEHLLMEARMQVNSELSDQIASQKQTYQLIHEYGRQQLRREIQKAQRKVFSDSAYLKFQNKIRSYFKF